MKNKNILIIIMFIFLITGCSNKTEFLTNTEIIKEKIYVNESIFEVNKIEVPIINENDTSEDQFKKVKSFIIDIYIQNIELKSKLKYLNETINNFNNGVKNEK